jgi:hypothetical protein
MHLAHRLRLRERLDCGKLSQVGLSMARDMSGSCSTRSVRFLFGALRSPGRYRYSSREPFC